MAKAGKPKFLLNKETFRKVTATVRPDVEAAARKVAASVRGKVPDEVPVTTLSRHGNDGRPVVLVTIAHPSGLARQAKHGVLTRAAAENGLEVTRYKER